MKKIIIPFDDGHFSEGAFTFAKKMNEAGAILLIGLFVPRNHVASLWSYAAGADRFVVPLVEKAQAEDVKKNISIFETRCKELHIRYEVHKNFTDMTLSVIKQQSRFADLIILGSEIFFRHSGDNATDFLEDALHDAECPVVVVPENFEFPENAVLAYDGSDNAVFAIKAFSYLFPGLRKSLTVLFDPEHFHGEMPERKQLDELLSAHFDHVSVVKFCTPPKVGFTNWLGQFSAPIIVCGAYGRSDFSRMLKKSFMRDVLEARHLPVFIAHQ